MGKKVKAEMKIIQKPVGLRYYQHLFLERHPEINHNELFRDKLDEQINILEPEFLEKKEDICELCNKPFNSEYHMSDQCVNINEEENENKFR